MNQNVEIDNVKYIYTNSVRADDATRLSFDSLAQKTFELSFEQWQSMGFWQDKYIPHVMIHDGEVVSNVSVNIIDMCLRGQSRRYIQLGTVMTDREYTGRGLSKFLMNRVLEDWKSRCDGMFLFANDSVLDFYPRFGFVPAEEYAFSLPCCCRGRPARQLNMNDRKDVKLLLDFYVEGNPFSAFQMLNNPGLIMFYCTQFLKDCVYFLEDIELAVIAEHNGEDMLCYDVFGGGSLALETLQDGLLNQLLSRVARPETRRAVLGFTPSNTEGMQAALRQEDDTSLFLLSGKEKMFLQDKLMFPLLSHA